MCPQFNPDFRPFAVKYLALRHFRAILPLSSMVVRSVVLQDPPKHPFPAQLPFNNSSRALSPLESALTQVFILRHLKSFRMNTYTKTGGRVPLQASQFVNSLRPPTTPTPDKSATGTSPANPSLSVACRHFPSPIGVGVRTTAISSSSTLTRSLPRSSSFDFQPSTLNLFPAFSAPLRDPLSRPSVPRITATRRASSELLAVGRQPSTVSSPFPDHRPRPLPYRNAAFTLYTFSVPPSSIYRRSLAPCLTILNPPPLPAPPIPTSRPLLTPFSRDVTLTLSRFSARTLPVPVG